MPRRVWFGLVTVAATGVLNVALMVTTAVMR